MVSSLYYARAVKTTIMLSLGSIADNQANINKTNTKAIKRLLYYCATYPYATI